MQQEEGKSGFFLFIELSASCSALGIIEYWVLWFIEFTAGCSAVGVMK